MGRGSRALACPRSEPLFSDLYGESLADGADAAQAKNQRAKATRLEIVVDDVLAGVGAITDMTFGVDADELVSSSTTPCYTFAQ